MTPDSAGAFDATAATDRRPARVKILYSTSGGGHLSAARALREGFAAACADRPGLPVEIDLVDFVDEYTSPAVRCLPAVYSKASRSPFLWWLWYTAVGGPRRGRAADAVAARLTGRAGRRLFVDEPAELYVSVHPALNGPLVRAMREERPPGTRFATVVTDLVTMTPMWFSPEVDLCVVPTREARDLALRSRLPLDRVHEAPYPIAEAYFAPAEAGGARAARAAALAALGLPGDRPVAVVVGGAEGVGPIAEVVAHLDALAPDGLVVLVVTGRNTCLARTLREREWRLDVRVEGLVPSLVDVLRAADVLLTKAGPASLLEAAAAGVPTVVFHRLPGQEAGNAAYVVRQGAAVEEREPRRAAQAALRLVHDPAARAAMVAAQRAVLPRGAARAVAEELLALLTGGRDGLRPLVPAPRGRLRLRRAGRVARAARVPGARPAVRR